MLTFLNCVAVEKMLTIFCTFHLWIRPPGINNCQAILFPMNTGTFSENRYRLCDTVRAESRNLMRQKSKVAFSFPFKLNKSNCMPRNILKGKNTPYCIFKTT